MENKPFNIIFYFSDQQRFDTINDKVTPFLCELAEEGINFTNTFTCQPVCGPARACLQTGIYASKNGCYVNNIALDENAQTIAKLLDKKGYDTAYIGKWHLASTRLKMNNQTKPIKEQLRGGYKYWRASDCLEFTSTGSGGYVYDNDGKKVEFDYYRADAINDLALEYLDVRDKSKPYFMFVSQLEPHHQNSTDQYECPEKYKETYKNMPIPKDLEGLKGNYETRYSDYLACCRSLDDNVKRLVMKLKENGEWENTILIYTSDHGCHFKTRNMEYKRSCHHASTHIPLIIAGGVFKGGKVYDGLVSLIDLPATILKLAGVDIPSYFDGIPIDEMINGEKSRDCVYVEISESQLGRAIITKDYTYSCKKRGSFGSEAKESNHYVDDKLYDNEKDPYQKNNLIRKASYKKIKKELSQKLLQEIKKSCGSEPKIHNKLTNYKLN